MARLLEELTHDEHQISQEIQDIPSTDGMVMTGDDNLLTEPDLLDRINRSKQSGLTSSSVHQRTGTSSSMIARPQKTTTKPTEETLQPEHKSKDKKKKKKKDIICHHHVQPTSQHKEIKIWINNSVIKSIFKQKNKHDTAGPSHTGQKPLQKATKAKNINQSTAPSSTLKGLKKAKKRNKSHRIESD